MNRYDQKRQTWNLALLEEVKAKIQQYPEQRFEQILWNMGLCGDHFYEEPWNTSERIQKQSSI